jgi:hypothetical protein
MDQNALHDPKIPKDAETQVQRMVSQRAFNGNCIGTIQA